MPTSSCVHTTSKSGVSRQVRYVFFPSYDLLEGPAKLKLVKMQCKWLGERVAAPSLRTVVKNAVTKESAPNWGPNATFRFPTHGGTGGIWTAVSDMIPAKSMRTGKKAVVERVNPVTKEVHFSTGRTVRYRHLVSTMALDGLLERLEWPLEKLSPLQKAAEGLVYSSTIVLGVGVRGERPSRIGDKCEH